MVDSNESYCLRGGPERRFRNMRFFRRKTTCFSRNRTLARVQHYTGILARVPPREVRKCSRLSIYVLGPFGRVRSSKSKGNRRAEHRIVREIVEPRIRKLDNIPTNWVVGSTIYLTSGSSARRFALLFLRYGGPRRVSRREQLRYGGPRRVSRREQALEGY